MLECKQQRVDWSETVEAAIGLVAFTYKAAGAVDHELFSPCSGPGSVGLALVSSALSVLGHQDGPPVLAAKLEFEL